MAFKESPRFPENIAAQSKFGPGFSTQIARNLGGYEARNRHWTYPLHEGDVGFVRTQAELDQLLAFFHGVAGMFDGFRFKNYNDYEVTASEGTFIQLTGSTWQLAKTRTYGAITSQWKVKKPVSSTVVVSGGSFTLDDTTGIITAVGSPTPTPTSWTGEFDFPVRFNTDKMLPMWISFELYDWQSIPIIELRL